MRSRLAIAFLLLVAGCAPPTTHERPAAAPAAVGAPHGGPIASPVKPLGNPAVGGVVLPVDGLLADQVTAAPTLTLFVRALAAAGLTDRLRAAGPLTVFAPTDEAFGRLQPGTVEALLKPENRASLVRLLDLHIVAGALTGAALARRVAADGGRATLTSVAGEPLSVTLTGGIVTLTDQGGNRSYVEIADVRGANGVIHLVNGVLVPRLN